MILNALQVPAVLQFLGIYKGAPIKLWNILLQYNLGLETPVSMQITHESLGMPRSYLIILVI
ncbi:hypothetical protein ANAPRD1_00704 [Anaplasma phagocytophilum]|nr:hypothetical protein ANAPRD1_00704 [Anaplasma phagocytophilum]